MRIYVTLCFSIIFLINNSFSQFNFLRDTSIAVYQNNNRLNNAWNGGINSAQFSNIDLNLDGIEDIIIFDRSGNKLSPYLNINNKFIFSPQYRNNFPDSIKSWMIMEDYNCDGKKDIFTYSTAGIAVYLNTSTTSSLQFNLASPLLINQTSGINIYVSPVDIPAISDIDNDGDIDILTFEITGGFVNYFQNMSIENYGNCEQLEYILSDNCWGNFYEGLNSYILDCINCNCSPLSIMSSNKSIKHAGSSLLAIDVDNDNDKDLILGDVSFNNLNLLINGGDNINAHITEVDSIFPENNTNTLAANIHIFPAAFYLDLTHDGIKDIVISTNMQNNSENYQSCWLYENNGTSTNLDLTFIKKDFLQDESVDLGEGAHPAFFDINNDNLMDLFVGNYGYHDVMGTPISKIAYFENTGTSQQPEYTLIDDDFANISTINLNTTLNSPALNLYPTFGDVNNDSYQDLIIGDADGKIHLFLNDQNNSFNLAIPNLSNIDVGYFATPDLADINQDGLIDLIVGNKSGTISYFENQGTLNNPDFSLEITNWGGIDVDSTYINNGFSSPRIIDVNGDIQLLTGSYSGKIYEYNNITNNVNGTFNQTNTINNDVWEGGKSSVAISDINNDNIMDIIIGNQCGGLSYFRGDTNIINLNNNIIQSNLNIYPNPTQKTINIDGDGSNVIIYNHLGELILRTNKNKINIEELSDGIYFIKTKSKSGTIIKIK